MDFNDLLAKLEKIDKKQTLMEQRLMEQLTLQQVQAAEKAAADEAAAVKKQGGWKGFTGWDPQTAGDIALAKLAAQHKLPGLFNSKGEFVVADDKRMDRGIAGQGNTPVQKAPPTPTDYEPLMQLGLVPGNAKGPSGLVNALTGGNANRSFDQAKTTSAKVSGDQSSAKFKADKLKQLNDLVTKLNAEVQGGNADPAAGKVDYSIPSAKLTNIEESLLKEFGLSEKADPSKDASMKTVNGMNIYTNDPPVSGAVGAFGANPNTGGANNANPTDARLQAGTQTAPSSAQKGSRPTTAQSTTQEKMDRFVYLMKKKKEAAAAGSGPTTVTNPEQATQKESLSYFMTKLQALEESLLLEKLTPEEEQELQALSKEVVGTVNSGAEGIPPEVLAAVKDFEGSGANAVTPAAGGNNKPASGYKGSTGAQEIQKLNPEIKDVNKIRVGQVLKMPNGQPDYTVKAGDTLDKIARGVKPAGQLDQIAAAKPANATSSAKPADATSSAKPADATSSAKPAPYVSSNKLANDWAYSVLQGKSEIAKVPPALKAEVDKVMANPPANWKKSDAATPAADNTASAKPPAASSGQVRIERLDMIKARSTQEYQAIVKAKGYKQGPDGKLSSSDERKADLFYKAEIQNGKIKNYPQLQPVAEELDRILSIAGLR